MATPSLATPANVLPLRTKIAFGIGAVGEWVYLGMFNTFIGIFYNQALGLSNALIGTAILLAMVGDAISDPAIGIVSDRWRSRWGRRHPFLFAAPLPLALALWAIFNPPDAILEREGTEFVMGKWALFSWLALWTIVSRFCVTLYTIPHLALGGEIVRSPNERSQLFSINAICGYAAGALFGFSAWTMLEGASITADGTELANHLIAESYVPLTIVMCATVFVCVFYCALGTFKAGRSLSQPPAELEPMSMLLFLRKILGTLKNRNYVFLLVGFFFFMISSALFETFSVFVNTFFWELKGESIRWVGLAALPGVVLGASSAPRLMRRFDRRPVLLGALTGLVVFAQLTVDLRLLGWFPDNDSTWLLPSLMANSFFFAASLGMAGVAILSMIGDVIDENELITGLREEGLFYSARAFFAKLSSSVGNFVAGLMLDLFVVMPLDAVPGEVDEGVLVRLGLAAGPIMACAGVVAIVFYSRYRLTREKHARILETLQQRAEQAPPPLAVSSGP